MSASRSPVARAWIKVVLRRSLLLLLGFTAVTTAFVVYGLPPLRELASDRQRIILPGPLQRDHARESKGDCYSCHANGLGRIDREGCLECHRVVADRIATGRGYHGSLTEPCESCHGDHRGELASLIELDEGAFNHSRSIYPLEGGHVGVECRKCHDRAGPPEGGEGGRYLGIPHGSCQDCHDDPHKGAVTPGKGCTDCHGVEGWKSVAPRFDHESSQFPLQALHAGMSCKSCHDSLRYLDADPTCVGCHQEYDELMAGRHREAGQPDWHYGIVTCTQCHDPAVRTPSIDAYRLKCVHCHNDHYGGMFLTRVSLIAQERERLPDDQQLTGREWKWLEKALNHNHREAQRFLTRRRR